MQIKSNWRDFPKENLKGSILECGPLHTPYPINKETKATYFDLCDHKELKKHYKEDPAVDETKIPKIDILGEISNMSMIKDQTFDAVVSSHVLEHTKNPLKAIQEWLRITKIGGYIFFVLPDYRLCFDRDRPLTTKEHLIMDFDTDIQEIELDHYIEVCACIEQMKGQDPKGHYLAQSNCHVHTFTQKSIKELLEPYRFKNRFNFEIITQDTHGMDVCTLLRRIK